jgi:hypothetical protein
MWLEWRGSLPLPRVQVQADRWPEVVRAWQSPTRGLYVSTSTVLLLLGGVLLAVVTAMWWWERRRSRHLRSHPHKLFEQVAREAGLSWYDRWLLTRMARQQRLPSALTLLLCPATLAHHAQQYALARAPGRRARIAARATGIARTVFAEKEVADS